MIPNNNLSVLPWYRSLEEQNARKWWVYDRVYPLFSFAGNILPFQLMRPPVRGEWGNKALEYNAIPVEEPGVFLDADDCITTAYRGLDDITRLYLYNLPAVPSAYSYDGLMGVALDGDGMLLETFKPITEGTYTGYWDLPEGTSTVYLLTRVPVSEWDGWAGTLDAAPVDIKDAVLFDRGGNEVSNIITELLDAGMVTKAYGDIDVVVFPGEMSVLDSLANGQYYIWMTDGVYNWYSEVFTVVNDIQPYLKIEWWDNEDFVMDAGVISYEQPDFHNILYLPSDLAKPQYNFSEEGEDRDGYFFPIKQISEKVYRFSFFAPEYLLDVMRLIRMADYVRVEYHGQIYDVDTFLITPEWEDNGDIAAVDAEFTTATVAKKIGKGYIV